MTADRLQQIVLRLANAAPTRYWLHWNYPRQQPWQMAVKVWSRPGIDDNLRVQMEGLGGTRDEASGLWIFERTDEVGQPFRVEPFRPKLRRL